MMILEMHMNYLLLLFYLTAFTLTNCKSLQTTSTYNNGNIFSPFGGHHLTKRNVFDPTYPSFPVQGQFPFVQPVPYPVPDSTTSPFDKFLPEPPSNYENDRRNPYMRQMHEAYDPKFGLGYHIVPGPINLGGSLQWPTYDIAQDTDTLSGTFAYSKPNQFRFGMQGGSFYPWMDDKYVNSVKKLSAADDLRSVLLRP